MKDKIHSMPGFSVHSKADVLVEASLVYQSLKKDKTKTKTDE